MKFRLSAKLLSSFSFLGGNLFRLAEYLLSSLL